MRISGQNEQSHQMGVAQKAEQQEDRHKPTTGNWFSRQESNVRIALIFARVVLAFEGIYIYFSPFQACMREGDGSLLRSFGIRHR